MLATLVVILDIIFLSLSVLAIVFYVCMIFGFWSGAPFVPSSHKVVKEMILLAGIQEGEHVYDLGSGDGRILIASARVGAQAHGWETHPMLVWLTRLKAWWSGFGAQVRVEAKSYWAADLKEADVILVYLLASRMQELKEKLLREVRPGTRVVSHEFKIPGWEPSAEEGSVRLYIVP
ncbi:MAG: hypothetical protein UX10_C0023G0001 [Candidatus Magasanikbacteria bacterium GW2011_GWA2_45_39]|uniref:DOT1 domain-containing protein n=1 Tax=Candidatus Magasanikbacteria bacterium GW2011_GWA2_45_39 TaxID=1619041 RepID=A0A0G1MEM1_9BACT|nr:MAG: hypothetical protein UX10_C0023G0001 [Candidatus Magasanikbacteria bacterium GW2011_GWA2_45_39]HBW74119.1 hypothetical protein [Candidatus Magasanikbacteria bacterium]